MEEKPVKSVEWFNRNEFSVLDLADWLYENHQDIKGITGVIIKKDCTVISTVAGSCTNAEMSYAGNILVERSLSWDG